jgi:hypothetical protein
VLRETWLRKAETDFDAGCTSLLSRMHMHLIDMLLAVAGVNGRSGEMHGIRGSNILSRLSRSRIEIPK